MEVDLQLELMVNHMTVPLGASDAWMLEYKRTYFFCPSYYICTYIILVFTHVC
jgi:hypothetical protein